MKKTMKRLISVIACAALCVALLPTMTSAGANSAQSLTDSFTAGTGTFSLTPDSRLYIITPSQPDAALLQTVQLVQGMFAAKSVPSANILPIYYGTQEFAAGGDIIICPVEENTLGDEGYRLSVTSSNITLSYYSGTTTYNGVLYGLQTVLKSMIIDGSSTMAACSITDVPDTKERTVMLDCARKYWTVDWIKNLISEMSWMGYNALELHITEDQGYRANIWEDSSGNLVSDCNGNDFRWIIGGNDVSWNTDYKDTTGGYYNADELTEIVNYAKARHIEIIPAVDYPTHSDALIAKFSSNYSSTAFSYQYNGQTYSDSGSISAGNTATLNVTDEYARNLSFAITQAYADFFGNLGCTKFNIGGDEVSGGSYTWATADYTTQNGGSNVKDAYVIYMNELAAMLKSNRYGADNHGYTVRAYNDCLFGTGFYYYSSEGKKTNYTGAANVSVDPDIEVCFWTAKNTHTSPATIAGSRTVYNCVNFYTYYVLRLTSGGADARADDTTYWEFNHSGAERIYSGCNQQCSYGTSCSGAGWNPSRFYGCSSSSYQENVTNNLGGGYFLIWGDWSGLDTEDNIWNRDDSYNLIDRMWSNAMKMWNWDADSALSYSEFCTYRDAVLTYPGFTSCTSAVPAYSSGEATLAKSNTEYTITIILTTQVGSDTREITREEITVPDGNSYNYTVPTLRGYVFRGTDADRFVPNSSGASCGTISGQAVMDSTVTVSYANTPYMDTLESLLAKKVTADGYTSDSYSAYLSAYDAAKTFYDEVSASPETLTWQEQVDEYAAALTGAQTALVRENGELSIEKAESVTSYVASGKQAVISVTTGGGVSGLKVLLDGAEVEVNRIASSSNADGTKTWLVQFRVPATPGNYGYQVCCDTSTDTCLELDITVK